MCGGSASHKTETAVKSTVITGARYRMTCTAGCRGVCRNSFRARKCTTKACSNFWFAQLPKTRKIHTHRSRVLKVGMNPRHQYISSNVRTSSYIHRKQQGPKLGLIQTCMCTPPGVRHASLCLLRSQQSSDKHQTKAAGRVGLPAFRLEQVC